MRVEERHFDERLSLRIVVDQQDADVAQVVWACWSSHADGTFRFLQVLQNETFHVGPQGTQFVPNWGAKATYHAPARGRPQQYQRFRENGSNDVRVIARQGAELHNLFMGTYLARRLARRADRGAEIHERLVEIEDVLVRDAPSPRSPTDASSSRGSSARRGATNTRNSTRATLVSRIAARSRNAKLRIGARRVCADALERQQRVVAIGRQLAAVARDRLARDRVQPPRPDVVAERPPRFGHVVLGRAGKRFERRSISPSHSWYFGSTRSTCVCCSITSETRM